MKALLGPRFAVAVVLALVSLAGCSSSFGGGGSKPTYIIVPAGTPIPGHPEATAPSQ
jgi:hypothetical protein